MQILFYASETTHDPHGSFSVTPDSKIERVPGTRFTVLITTGEETRGRMLKKELYFKIGLEGREILIWTEIESKSS